ncbi:hypothetical protein Hanom_Chr07g00615251 [Helianthus anomalus]
MNISPHPNPESTHPRRSTLTSAGFRHPPPCRHPMSSQHTTTAKNPTIQLHSVNYHNLQDNIPFTATPTIPTDHLR